jgi:radical SAM protein with 4Fe4S-binding SPASM domain
LATPAPVCDDDLGELFLAGVQERASQQVLPLNVMLELTLDCNIRCQHCYNFDRDQPRPARAPGCGDGARGAPLSVNEVLRLLGDIRAAGGLFLGLTGGEIFSYPHLFPVLDRARELHLAVQLLTNGTLLRPGVTARLAGYRNLLGLSVSLYGASAAVHDEITQVRGSWRRTWEGIQRVRAAGLAVRLKFIVMRQNAHEVAAMRAAADAGGYPYQVDLTITTRHDGTGGSLATRVDEQQLLQLHRGPLRDLFSHPTPAAAAIYPCNCARGNCAVLSNGDVTPCISVPWRAGNVREQPFIDIWRHSPVFQRIRALRSADYTACHPCPDKAYCARPRGAAYTASGSYTGVDPFVCQTAAAKRRVLEEDLAAAQQPSGSNGVNVMP